MLKKAIIEQYKNAELITITCADGEVTFIYGPNESGKSSSMEGIATCLVGKDKAWEFIHEKGEVSVLTVESDNYTVTRTLLRDKKGYTLKITDKDTGKVIPKSALKGFLNPAALDPTKFYKGTGPEQLAYLCGAAGIDISKYLKKRREALDDIKIIDRDIRNLEAETKETPVFMEKVDTKDISAKLVLLNERKVIHDKAQKDKETLQDGIAEKNRKIAEHKEAIQQLEADIDTDDDKIDGLDKTLVRIRPDYDSIDRYTLQLKNATEINDKAKTYTDHLEKLDLIKINQDARKDEVAVVTNLDTGLSTQINESGLPGGVTVENNVLMNGNVPVSEKATSKRWKIAIGIAFHIAKGMEFGCVMVGEGGDMLDEDNMNVLIKEAKKAKIPVIVERVNKPLSGNVIEIKSGRVIDE
jgi:hypothetical protein